MAGWVEMQCLGSSNAKAEQEAGTSDLNGQLKLLLLIEQRDHVILRVLVGRAEHTA